LTTNGSDQTIAEDKQEQKEKLKRIVTAQTKQTANLIKSWLDKNKNESSKNFGTRGKVQ